MNTTNASELDPSFDAFLQSLHEPDNPGPLLSPLRYCEALQIDVQTLADLAGVRLSTITSAPASLNVQGFLRESLRVIRAATDVSGDVDKPLFWYRNEPIAEFRHMTAEQLVAEKGSDALL